MSFAAIGAVYTPASLAVKLAETPAPAWAKGVCLHHTASPSLAMRPRGLTLQHIQNIRWGYVHENGWSSGPHFFVDEDDIWAMTPLNERGVHAQSFNATHFGIEVLGNYDQESPLAGRGLACWRTAAGATRVLLRWLNLPPNEKTVLFHRDDPKTRKTCPGKQVEKDWVLTQLEDRE